MQNSYMHRVPIGNDLMPLNKLLDAVDARLLSNTLSFFQKLSLALTKTAYLATMQPKGFTAPTEIYAVKGRKGLFISYKQGFSETIYDIEEEKK